MKLLNTPRTIDPNKTFNALVQWFHDEVIVRQGAPGLLIGLSGTDSLVAFCAAAKALEMAGKGNRMLGVHFAPSEDFLYDHPEAEVHLWFRNEVLPWLRKQAPNAEIIVDTSIDWRCDGLRWGSLMDLSVVSNERGRQIRSPEEQYWVVGTRNLTEHVLHNYSNVSMAVSLQPLIHLWKSEILQISEYLGAPQIAITKSCETDCICGRMRLASNHIREVDEVLMNCRGELSSKYLEDRMPAVLYKQLRSFISAQLDKNKFKSSIPYTPDPSVVSVSNGDPLVAAFEDGSLNIREFNHRKHLYIAYCYLSDMGFVEAYNRYCSYLKIILDKAGQSHRFSSKVTRLYFERLDGAMIQFPKESFDELVEKCPEIMQKITA